MTLIFSVMFLVLLSVSCVIILIIAEAYKLLTQSAELSSSVSVCSTVDITSSSCQSNSCEINSSSVVNVSVSVNDGIVSNEKRTRRSRDMTVQTILESSSAETDVEGVVDCMENEYTGDSGSPRVGSTTLVLNCRDNSHDDYARSTTVNSGITVQQTTPELLRHFFPTTLETIREID
jgi:hypothetical protein